MAASREERMQQRLRGAQRHQIEDISFGPLLPVDEEERPASPILGTDPSSSNSQRRQLVADHNERPASSSPPPSPQPAAGQPISSPEVRPPVSQLTNSSTNPRRGVRKSREAPTPRSDQIAYEEVTESPADAPGSGQRRRVRISAVASQQSVALQEIMSAERRLASAPGSSSPLTRKSREMRPRHTAGPKSADASLPIARRSARLSSSPAANDEVDELSPEMVPRGDRSLVSVDDVGVIELLPGSSDTGGSLPPSSPSARAQTRGEDPNTNAAKRPQTKSQVRLSDENDTGAGQLPPQPMASAVRQKRILAAKPDELAVDDAIVSSDHERGEDDRDGESNAEENTEAEAVDDQEAARRLGRKRPRQSLPAPSPELDVEVEEPHERAKKRRRPPQAFKSPAKQSQPAQRQATKKPAAQKIKERKPSTEENAGDAVVIPVYRFTRRPRRSNEEGEDETVDPGIPFANRGGPNSVDLLWGICEEMAEKGLVQLRGHLVEAGDAVAKRACRAKIAAIKAFQDEMRTKLSEHTIALDQLYALKKRVRATQKEKLGLREEILRLRAERDQVSMRIEALRMRHAVESTQALRHIQISSAMHDIELAVEEGRSAPELSAPERKRADLANLEILMSRVGDQVCADGHGGGILTRIKSFNAYLERAASALQTR